MTPERAFSILQTQFITEPTHIKPVTYRSLASGTKVFGIFVAVRTFDDGLKVKEITNYFCLACGLSLKDLHGRWEARYNPGYNLEDAINDKWREVVSKNKAA